MSKHARIINSRVHEIIPESATIPSIEYWYGPEFAAQCVEVPDEVQPNWTYDIITQTYSAPVYNRGVSKTIQIANLKTQLTATDYKVIKCYEYSLMQLAPPYDIVALHTERQALRDQINTLEV